MGNLQDDNGSAAVSLGMLLNDDKRFSEEFCAPLTLKRLEGVPVTTLRLAVSVVHDLMPLAAFSTPVLWSPTPAPQPVLVAGLLDGGRGRARILPPKVVFATLRGELHLVADANDVREAGGAGEHWGAWAVIRRGVTRERSEFLAYLNPLSVDSGAIRLSVELEDFLLWIARQQASVRAVQGASSQEFRISWPRQILALTQARDELLVPHPKGEGSASDIVNALSSILMARDVADSLLPISHTLRAALETVQRLKEPATSIQAAERDAALRYLKAFQLLVVDLAPQLGLALPPSDELGAIGRGLADLSQRIHSLIDKVGESKLSKILQAD